MASITPTSGSDLETVDTTTTTTTAIAAVVPTPTVKKTKKTTTTKKKTKKKQATTKTSKRSRSPASKEDTQASSPPRKKPKRSDTTPSAPVVSTPAQPDPSPVQSPIDAFLRDIPDLSMDNVTAVHHLLDSWRNLTTSLDDLREWQTSVETADARQTGATSTAPHTERNTKAAFDVLASIMPGALAIRRHCLAAACAPGSPCQTQVSLLVLYQPKELLMMRRESLSTQRMASKEEEEKGGETQSGLAWFHVLPDATMETMITVLRAAQCVLVAPPPKHNDTLTFPLPLPKPRVWEHGSTDSGSTVDTTTSDASRLAWAAECMQSMLLQRPLSMPAAIPTDTIRVLTLAARTSAEFHQLMMQPNACTFSARSGSSTAVSDLELCSPFSVRLCMPTTTPSPPPPPPPSDAAAATTASTPDGTGGVHVSPCSAIALCLSAHPHPQWLVMTAQCPGRIVDGPLEHPRRPTTNNGWRQQQQQPQASTVAMSMGGQWSEELTLFGYPSLLKQLMRAFGQHAEQAEARRRFLRRIAFALCLDTCGNTPVGFSEGLDQAMRVEFGDHDPSLAHQYLPPTMRGVADTLDVFIETVLLEDAYASACTLMLPFASTLDSVAWPQSVAWYVYRSQITAQPIPYDSQWRITDRRIYCLPEREHHTKSRITMARSVRASPVQAVETDWTCYDGVGRNAVPYTNIMSIGEKPVHVLEPSETQASYITPAFVHAAATAAVTTHSGRVAAALSTGYLRHVRGLGPDAAIGRVMAALFTPTADPWHSGDGRVESSLHIDKADIDAALITSGTFSKAARHRIVASSEGCDLMPVFAWQLLAEQLVSRAGRSQQLRCKMTGEDRLATWKAPHPIVTLDALDTLEWLELKSIRKLTGRTAGTIMRYLICATDAQTGRGTCHVLSVQREAPLHAAPRTKFGRTTLVIQRYPAPLPTKSPAFWSFDRFAKLLRRSHFILRFYAGRTTKGS